MTTEPTGRARSLEELGKLMAPMFSQEGFKHGMSLKLRPTDVVVTPYGKSGTTWTQQIVHTLRTRGDMDFDDISRVVPWIETAFILELDLDAEQRANPRAFKSHLSADLVPKGGRYINVVRDPADAAVSMFKFQEGWFVEPGAIDIDEFVQSRMQGPLDYFKHLLSWWPRRKDADVLFLAYEQMLADAPTTIKRIATFIDVPLDDELLQLTTEHSSLPFMLKHKDRFDDAMMRTLAEDKFGVPAGGDSAKVRAGKSGSGVSLNAETQALLAKTWEERITPELGFANYAELLSALAAES